MIDSKILLARGILDKESIIYTIDKVSDNEMSLYIDIKNNINIDQLIELWGILDTLEFRTFNGCTTNIKLIDKETGGVVKFSAKEKYSSFYGISPSSSGKYGSTSGNKNLPFPKFPYASKSFIEITEPQLLTLSINLIHVDFSYNELNDISDTIFNNYYEYQGPNYIDDEFFDSIECIITKPVPKDYKNLDTPDSVKLVIHKYTTEEKNNKSIIFLLSQTQRWKNVSKRSFYRCEGMTGLENAIDEIGLWKI